MEKVPGAARAPTESENQPWPGRPGSRSCPSRVRGHIPVNLREGQTRGDHGHEGRLPGRSPPWSPGVSRHRPPPPPRPPEDEAGRMLTPSAPRRRAAPWSRAGRAAGRRDGSEGTDDGLPRDRSNQHNLFPNQQPVAKVGRPDARAGRVTDCFLSSRPLKILLSA